MPLAINPKARCTIELESDVIFYEPADRPRFIYRFLTGAEWLQIADMQTAIGSANDGADALNLAYQAAAVGLVNWENIIDPETKNPIKFNLKKLNKIVGLNEAMELATKILQQTPDYGDKKKFELQSESNTAESVNNAPDK